ncbi:hypothetical protein DM01DRAFT_1339782 [Hesseltinella vesiculosa]|uniref:Uncharacterized protein n=1 Tax=Hesseltinella vesiculosa TaxID=101127 RepID=A0A1X2G5S6_9FUNG|nr:hypothetical protein DM01DRAFT_1339782 [Hesseltinella vesiculosa]
MSLVLPRLIVSGQPLCNCIHSVLCAAVNQNRPPGGRANKCNDPNPLGTNQSTVTITYESSAVGGTKLIRRIFSNDWRVL